VGGTDAGNEAESSRRSGISKAPLKRVICSAYSSKERNSKPKMLPSRPTSTWVPNPGSAKSSLLYLTLPPLFGGSSLLSGSRFFGDNIAGSVSGGGGGYGDAARYPWVQGAVVGKRSGAFDGGEKAVPWV
jgi:hypothetical protein